MSRWPSRWMVVLWLVITILLASTAVAADVVVFNRMAATVNEGGAGIKAFVYGSGTEHLFATNVDFSSGTVAGPATVINDSVQINGVDPNEWWNADWQKRQCFDVTASVPVGQYPVRVEVDTSGLAADDLRVVADTSPASVATPVSHYTESQVGSTTTSVWFQAPVGASQRYCVYFDASSAPGPGSTSDQLTPFTYTGGQTVSYYTMTDAYTGAGQNGQVQVVSYIDGNVVSDGASTVTLNTGDLHVFSGINEQGEITATGPIDASFNRFDRESLLPESFADNQFVFPTNRERQQFWVRSPHGTTTIEALNDGVVIATVSIGPADGSVSLSADVGGTDFVVLRSTNGLDFLASHKSTNDRDTFHGVPWFGDELVGVASVNLLAGATSAGSVAYEASNGASGSFTVSSAAVTTLGGNGNRGAGRAYRLSSGQQFHAIQQADTNGWESTSFLPTRLLSQTYRIPIAHRYVAIACPVPATTVTIAGTAFNCDTGAGVGHIRRGLGSYPAGTLIEADHPIFVYYESVSGSDEHNVYGGKGAIPYAGDISVVAGPVEVLEQGGCVTWISPVFATADVFGLASIDVDGTFTYQISFDGGPFVGPDGAATSSYADGIVVPFVADGSTSAQIRVEFCGNGGTQLRSVSFECELTEVDSGEPAVQVVGEGSILRVYPNAAGTPSWIELVSATGPDSYQLSSSANGVHVEAVAGVVSNPAPIFPAEPYSVSLSGLTPQTSQLSVLLVEQDAVRLEVPVSFDITG